MSLPPRRSILSLILFSPQEPRFRAFWRLLGQFSLLIVGAVLFGALLLSFRFAKVTPVIFFAAGQGVTFLAITASIWLARRWLDHRSFVSLGLSLNRKALSDLLFGVGLTGLMMALIFCLEWAAGWLKFAGFAWQTQSLPQLFGDMLWILLAFILVGWQEELLSRGYWLQNLEAGLNLPWAVLLSSAAFAILHLSNPSFTWIDLVGLFASGLFMAYAYVRTRQLWLSIGIHIGWNFFEGVVFGFPVSGLQGMPQLVRQSVQGPALFTGGPFGPEAGLVLLPALLLGVGLLFFYTRQPVSSL